MSLKTLSWRAGLWGSDGDHSAPVCKDLYSGGRRKRQKCPEDVWEAAGVYLCAGWGWGETRARLFPRAFQPECVSSSEGLFCGPSHALSVAHEKN